MNLICIGKNTFKRILHISGYMQILELIMKLLVQAWEIKQLKFMGKVQHVLVII